MFSLFEWIFGRHSMTSDFIGTHGEFDKSDEDRAICEDIFADRAADHDFDIRREYGWEHEMNYDSDGYRDEEDW